MDIKIYFIYSGKNDFSNKFIESFDKEVVQNNNHIVSFIANKIDVGEDILISMESDIKNCDIIVILWSKDCYSKRVGKIGSEYISFELALLQELFKKKLILIYTIDSANKLYLKKFYDKPNPNRDEKKIIIEIKNRLRLIKSTPVNTANLKSKVKFRKHLNSLVDSILKLTVIYYKIPWNYRNHLTTGTSFINDYFRKWHGGFFVPIRKIGKDSYAEILKDALVCVKHQIFAVMIDDWLRQISKEKKTNIEYLNEVNKKVMTKNLEGTRIIIGKGNKRISDYLRQIKIILDKSKNMNLFYTNENKLDKIFSTDKKLKQTKVQKNSYPYDFALFDENVFIIADNDSVKTQLMEHAPEEITNFYQGLSEKLKDADYYVSQGLLYNKQKLKEITRAR